MKAKTVAPRLRCRPAEAKVRADERPSLSDKALEAFAGELREWLTEVRDSIDGADRAHADRLLRLLEEPDTERLTELIGAMQSAATLALPVMLRIGWAERQLRFGDVFHRLNVESNSTLSTHRGSKAGRASGPSRNTMRDEDLETAAKVLNDRWPNHLNYKRDELAAALEKTGTKPKFAAKNGWHGRVRDLTKRQIEARALRLKSRN